MQKILIIGNGFDLHHFLPTKYEHFIEVLQNIEKIETQDSYTFNEIFNRIDEIFKQSIIESYNTNKIVYSHVTIKAIKEQILNNTWYQTFRHIKEVDTWIDFETQIEKILNIVKLFFEKATQFIETNLSKTFIKVACIDTVNPEIGFNLNSYQYKTLLNLKIILPRHKSENEMYEGNINECYFLVEKEAIYAINEKLILENLSQSLDQFIEIFKLYFTEIIEPFYKNYKQLQLIKDNQGENVSIHTLNESVLNHYQSAFKYIYSFNYTPTIQRYYQTTSVKYLHGSATGFQNMVLGVNDINEELKQHKMFAFTKYYQKLYKNTDFDFLSNDVISINQAQIYIWGHSLDQSDGEYLSKIFSIFQKNNCQSKLIVFYHSNIARALQLQNLLRICGKEVIENAMKNGYLTFQESTNDNLYRMINIAQ